MFSLDSPPGRDNPIGSMTGPMWMPKSPPTLASLLAIHPQPIPVIPLVAVGLLLIYGLGVWRLRRRGDRWPVVRTVSWVSGIFSVLSVTATGVDGYGMELFSVHMVQHMVLSMGSPILLVLGGPITLLLRALPASGRPGGFARHIVLAVLHSRIARIVTNPVVTVGLFLFSLYGLYFTPLFDQLMATWWGHNLMLLHFLAIGSLYFWNVIGIDPHPSNRRKSSLPAPVTRLFEIAATIPFHAFFGVIVMMSVSLIVKFYSTPVSGWNVSPLADQALGGGIAWGFTEVPTLLVLGVLLARWQTSESRATRKSDRRQQKSESELMSYNAYLATLAAHDERGTR